MQLGRPHYRALAVLLVLAACEPGGNGPDPTPVPTTLSLNVTTVNFDAFGATASLVGTVKDQTGTPIAGQAVAYASADTTVVSVTAGGVVTAVGNGTTTVTATSGSLTPVNVAVTVAQVPGQVAETTGDAQMGAVGAVLAESLVVEVADRLGNAMQGVTVDFAVSANGGSVSPAAVTSDALGQAATEWTLGTLAGMHMVTATPGTGTGSFQFSATVNAGPPDSLIEVSGNSQTAEANSTLPNPLVVQVVDQYGNAVYFHDIDFLVTGGTGVLNGGTGSAVVFSDSAGEAPATWTLGPEIGGQSVNASGLDGGGGSLKGSPITFNATSTSPVPASVEVFEGDNQTGLVGKPVNFDPAVRVLNTGGGPFQNAAVTFAVGAGGGSGTGLVTTTDVNGVARVGDWTLGASPAMNTMTATVTGGGITNNPITFTATGQDALFDIEIRFTDSVTTSQAQAFKDAELFWEKVLFGELQDIPLVLAPGQNCAGITLDSIDETIDDLLIFAELTAIDGPFGVLGQAGACLLRTTGLLPVVGGMLFDTADLGFLEANGELDDVVLHEMGHVLGVGTLWPLLPSQANPFLKNPSVSPGTPGADTYFDGPNTLLAFDDVGGAAYVGGAKVPVENSGTQGSADGHWRESVFTVELMTPSLNSGVPNPISIVTVASFLDLGYLTNFSDAQTYALPGPAPLAGSGRPIDLRGDIWRGPMLVVDQFGRIVRVIEQRQ